MVDLSKYSFGATSAITTSMALIVGLGTTLTPKLNIVSTLLVLAIADNVSDSLGIHVFRESECVSPKKTSKTSTVTNFLSRLLITFAFVFIILFLQTNEAIVVSIIFGLAILSLMSYFIAKNQNKNPITAIIEHVGIAILLMAASRVLVGIITGTIGA